VRQVERWTSGLSKTVAFLAKAATDDCSSAFSIGPLTVG
jgi:hypothetical protein